MSQQALLCTHTPPPPNRDFFCLGVMCSKIMSSKKSLTISELLRLKNQKNVFFQHIYSLLIIISLPLFDNNEWPTIGQISSRRKRSKINILISTCRGNVEINRIIIYLIHTHNAIQDI